MHFVGESLKYIIVLCFKENTQEIVRSSNGHQDVQKVNSQLICMLHLQVETYKSEL